MLSGAPILGLIKLLLGEWSDKKPQALDLLGIQDSVEQVRKVVDSNELAFRDIARDRVAWSER